MTDAFSPGRPSRAVILVVLAALLSGGCGRPDQVKQAAELLDKGLQAHVDGRFGEATQTYNDVLRLDPRNKLAFYNLGLIAQVVNRDNVAAENNYRLCLSIDPDYTPALYNLAILEEAGGDPKAAESLYRKVIAINSRDAKALWNLGLLLRRTNRTGEGDQMIARALQADPSVGTGASPPPSFRQSPSPATS
jgi:Tfp pilus assembly protein PilF